MSQRHRTAHNTNWRNFQDTREIIITKPQHQCNVGNTKPTMKHVGEKPTYNEDGEIIVKTNMVSLDEGKRIAQARNKLGMKQKEFAFKFGIAEKELVELEVGKGKRTPAASRILNFIKNQEKTSN